MNIEKYRITNLSEEEIESKIENEYCSFIEARTNKNGKFCIKSHTPCIRGSFIYGKGIVYGRYNLYHIPFAEIKDYSHCFLCTKKERKELIEAIENAKRLNSI
jgi:hypothetical protein